MKEADFKIKKLKKSSHYKKMQTIGKPNGKHSVFKYINIDRALEFIKTKELCFIEPSIWNDPYEKRFYNADYSNIDYFHPPKKVYSICTTSKKTSEPAWRVYSFNSKGLTSRCVLFKFKRSSFLKSVDDYAQKNNFDFYEGEANYLFNDSIIKDMHLRGKYRYDDFFNNMNLDKYLNLLLIKRQAFEYEKEIRYFLINKSLLSESKFLVPFDVIELIESIWYDKDCSVDEIKKLNDTCRDNNIKVPIMKFDLYDASKEIKIDSNY